MAQSSGGEPSNGRSSAPRRPQTDDAPDPQLSDTAPVESDVGRGGTIPNRKRNPKDRPAGTRVPPHNLDAEEALLGSMMLSGQARELSCTRLDSRDFYKPAHGHVFEALRRLWLDGQPVDDVTVWDELERGGLASSITEGRSILTTLVANTPSTSSAERYAEIIERASRQRELIAWADEIQQRAYAGTEWHEQLGHVLELGNRNGVVHSPSTLEVADLAAILEGTEDPERPFWLMRTDGRALLYPARIHDLHGPPSVGKTWVSNLVTGQVLAAGGSVLVVDHEDSARATLDRLRATGAPLEAVADPSRFRFVKPTGAFGAPERAHLEKILDELEPDLVILDGVAESLAMNGFDEISNTEVLLWRSLVVDPLRSRGAAVLMLDHVTKSTQDRARGARGAGAKLGAIDGASYEVLLTRAYSRHRAGLLRLKVAKDRHGHVGSIGEIVADLHVRPSAGGLVVALELEAPTAEERHKLTGLMQTLSRRLEGATGPLAQFALFAGMGTEKRHLETALADLLADGYAEQIGTTGTITFRSLRPYREDPEEPTGPNPTEGEPAGSGQQPTEEPMF